MKARAKRVNRHTPGFSNEDAEREFWAGHDTVEFFDWSKAVRALFPALKPSTATISLRLPASMLDELRALANARDVPYQSLLKVFLAERIATERGMRRKVSA
jgi:predicted DNA binding CopG/RHH family protein